MVAVGLALLTLVAYQGVRHNDFIYYDDPDYVLKNPRTQSGLTWETVKWAFTESHASNWHPITWLSHALDCQLYGLNPAGHHVTNVLFHVANVLLLFALLRRLTGAFWRAALVAALFAVHPQRVESVAWVAERKDVLSGFFFLLTLLTYAAYAQACQRSDRSRWPAYAAALVFLALGLMSKPMLVTTPFVLLLLDVWPLRRVDLLDAASRMGALRRLVIEKWPFFLLITVSSVVTFLAQREGKAVMPLAIVPLEKRIGNAVASYWEYLWRTVAPADLSVFYTYRDVGLAMTLLAGAGLAAVTFVSLWLLRRHGYLGVGWLWFLGTLVPVIGLVQVGSQRMADRYAYLPLIGIYIAVVWLLAWFIQPRPRWRPVAALASVVMLAALTWRTADRVRDWRDTEQLFAAAIRADPNNSVAHAGLGAFYLERGLPERAIDCFDRSIAILPTFSSPYGGKGKALLALGQLDQAAEYFRRVIEIEPSSVEGNLSYGLTLLRLGRAQEAERYVRLGLSLAPHHVPGVLALATVMLESGRASEAQQLAESVREKAVADPAATELLTGIFERTGQSQRSEAYLRRAVEISPRNPRSRQRLGEWLAAHGRGAEAIEQFRRAVTLNPTNSIAHSQLATSLLEQKQVPDALSAYREALRWNPDNLAALNNTAWLLATSPEDRIRNGKEAVQLAERAARLTQRGEALVLGTLAAAYAEDGQYEVAVKTALEARDLALGAGQADLAQRNLELSEVYRSRRAHREPPP